MRNVRQDLANGGYDRPSGLALGQNRRRPEAPAIIK